MEKLEIDRQKVKDVFARYTGNYNTDDEKIKLKVEHTYRVADLCDRIAKSLGLSGYDTDIAWLIGMLHDIGRFEQLKNYGTFSDKDSINHAHYAVKILFDDGKIKGYLGGSVCGLKKPVPDLQIIKKAIWNHNVYRIEEKNDDRTRMFCDIIRDADKLDIFRVINDTPVEAIYDISKKELLNSGISDTVMQAFMEKHAVLKSLHKTPADRIVSHVALAFELVFPVSINIAKEQGYLEKIMDFKTCNKKTEEQFHKIREIMEEYMKEQVHKM